VYVDTREPPRNYEFLKKVFPNHIFEKATLQEGDYSTDKVLVERKTVADLYGSIVGNGSKPGRLIKQVSRISCHDKVLVILVIGNISSFIENMKKIGIKVNVDILYGALASISCRERMHVLWMEEEWNALITMVRLMQKIEDDEYMVPSRRDPDVLLARYFKITLKQLKELKSKYPTINDIANATEKDLMSIKGIGKVKAKGIKELIYNGW
jgi:ERCC4-type nuclease